MLIKFTEEQSMIRDMVRDFTKNEVAPRDKWMDENGFDHELYNKLYSRIYRRIYPNNKRLYDDLKQILRSVKAEGNE